MALDADTVVALLALLSLASGLLLLAVGRGSGDAPTAVLWGAANIFVAFGVTIILGGTAPDLAFLCIIIAAALMWASMAAFNNRSVPPIAALGAGLVWLGIAYAPGLDLAVGPRGAVYLVLCAAFLAGAGYELWRGRAERLPARWPLLTLIVVDLAAVLFGVTQIVSLEEILTPGEANFWPVYLAAIIFNVGSTVMVMSVIKERAAARSRAAADTDGLTELPNRGAVFRAGVELVDQARDGKTPIGILIFDLDRFKSVNDRFGHGTGDAALRVFAAALRAGVRPRDIVGRIGGEEFIAVVPGVGIEAAVAIADRVRRTFAEQAEWIDGVLVRGTVSAGVVVVDPANSEASFEAALNSADAALYQAKSNGRDQVTVADGVRGRATGNLVQLA